MSFQNEIRNGFHTVTLRQLQIFQQAAREHSLVRAAEKLHLTPPAVTIQMKELEKRLDIPLFYKQGKTLSLTNEGRFLLKEIKKIQTALQGAELAVQQLKNIEVARLTIGMVSPAKYFLPSILSLFTSQYPGVEIKLIEGNRELLMERLRDNEVDFAVMGRTPPAIDTTEQPFAKQPHVFIAAPNHPLAKKKRLTPAQLKPYPLLMREQGSGTRSHCEALLAAARIETKIVLESSSNETIKQAVIADMGISFLSMNTLGLELDNHLIRILPVCNTPVISTWYVVSLGNKTLSPAADRLRTFIVDSGSEYLNARFDKYL